MRVCVQLTARLMRVIPKLASPSSIHIVVSGSGAGVCVCFNTLLYEMRCIQYSLLYARCVCVCVNVCVVCACGCVRAKKRVLNETKTGGN